MMHEMYELFDICNMHTVWHLSVVVFSSQPSEETENMTVHLSKTLLAQAHLCPLPMTSRPILWVRHLHPIRVRVRVRVRVPSSGCATCIRLGLGLGLGFHPLGAPPASRERCHGSSPAYVVC